VTLVGMLEGGGTVSMVVRTSLSGLARAAAGLLRNWRNRADDPAPQWRAHEVRAAVGAEGERHSESIAWSRRGGPPPETDPKGQPLGPVNTS
jgi:hypothetical protein